MPLLANHKRCTARQDVAPTHRVGPGHTRCRSHLSQIMLQRSLKAAERLSRISLIQELEKADRNLQFDFLGLPAEIREMVLKYICISSATIIHPQQQPAIARTCRLMRNEAMALYYSSNRFSIFVSRTKPGLGYTALSGMNSWLHELEPYYLASVHSSDEMV